MFRLLLPLCTSYEPGQCNMMGVFKLQVPAWRFMGRYKGFLKGPFKGIYGDSIRV